MDLHALYDGTMQRVIEGMFAAEERQTLSSAISFDEKQKLYAFQRRVKEIVAEEASWETFEEPLTASYQKVFSESDVQQLVSFFREGVGKKWIQEQGTLRTEFQRLMEEKMKQMEARVEKLTEEALRTQGMKAPSK